MTRIFLTIVAVGIALLASAEDKVYKIGDFYNDGNGVTGYVFEVSNDGKHGKIVAYPIREGGELFKPSYNELVKAGVPERRNQDGEPMYLDMPLKTIWCDATSKTDGAANTAKLLNKFKELKTKYRFDRKYLSDIEEQIYQQNSYTSSGTDNIGWYIPAIKELESFYAAVAQDNLNQLIKQDCLNNNNLGNVGNRETYWNNFLKIPQGFFWSSTQNPNDTGKSSDAMWVNLDIRDGVEYEWYPNENYWCILIHKF